ncbi:MAG: tripartite tricarboxylate transporter TctB family protein [Thermodesulfobacteriota bacterium]
MLLLICGMTIWGSINLSMGTLHRPGPGFFPFLLAIVLAFFSLALIFQNWARDKASLPFWERQNWLRPLLGLIILTGYAILLNSLGFLISTFLFLIIWMVVIERLSWKTIFGVSIATTIVLFLIFGLLLEVPLPKGLLAK